MHIHHHHRRLFNGPQLRRDVFEKAAVHLLARTPPDVSSGGSSGGDSSSSSDYDDSDSSSSTTSSSDSSSTSRCADSNTGVCEKPTNEATTTTLPVVLGVVIPIVVAIVIMLVLHRRHVKRLKMEDSDDKYKSYDFGLDDVVVPSKAKKGRGPAMEQREKGGPQHQHGVSLDIDLQTHLPPPSILGAHYGISTSTLQATPVDGMSGATTPQSFDFDTRSGRGVNPFDDKYAESTGRATPQGPPAPVGEIQQPPSAYLGPTGNRRDSPNNLQRTDSGRALTPQAHEQNHWGTPEIREPNRDSASSSGSDMSLPKNLQHSSGQGQFAMSVPRISLPGDGPSDDIQRDSTQSFSNAHEAQHRESGSDTLDRELGEGNFGMEESAYKRASARMSVVQPPVGYQLNPKRMTAAGIRPLPPDDPNETPDQRASRIRSFYKEYFDPSKAKDQNATKSMYFGDMEDAPVDSIYGAENVPPVPPLPAGPNAPFAEPMPRRAMTPPPRMPHDSFAPPPSISFGYDSRPGSRGTARSGSPSVRVESSVSNRYGPIPPPPRQQKRRPPPAPLQALPTPHKMTDDSLITLNPLDFAPPSTSKAQREGRPSTPQSGRIPYVPPPTHTPLVSSYDDLAIMPSPHNLRKSTTFTALDFAPPPRFRNDPSRPGSPLVPPSPNFNDGASLRAPSAASTRTGAMSPAAVMTLRSGANRVSRLPPSMVGTMDDMSTELKPKWDIGRQ